jgi:hypothetical protein
MEDREARMRLSVLEERMRQREQDLACLRCEVTRQSCAHESVENRVRGEAESASRQASEAQEGVGAVRREVEDFRGLLREVRELAASARVIALASQELSVGTQKKVESMETLLGRVARTQADMPAPRTAGGTVTGPALTQLESDVKTLKIGFHSRKIDSVIISDFPEILAEFHGMQFSLLWRGGRDGFGAPDFHSRCDGHANTLTVILDTDGNIFGGFTPVAWESRVWNGKSGNDNNCRKTDPSQKSFVFTLKNPHNIAAQRFLLKPDMKDNAILCYSTSGPHFWDIGVKDNCNANTNSYTCFGNSYTNSTGLGWETFFTGSRKFQVKEIEVFEITKYCFPGHAQRETQRRRFRS